MTLTTAEYTERFITARIAHTTMLGVQQWCHDMPEGHERALESMIDRICGIERIIGYKAATAATKTAHARMKAKGYVEPSDPREHAQGDTLSHARSSNDTVPFDTYYPTLPEMARVGYRVARNKAGES